MKTTARKGLPRFPALSQAIGELWRGLKRILLEPLLQLLQGLLDAVGGVLGWVFATARRQTFFTYGYLLLGVVVMFGPVLWLVMSSFKSSGDINRFPPRFLPYHQELVAVDGFDEPLPLYNVTLEDGSSAQLVQIRRVGLEAQMMDPADPEAGVIKVKLNDREPVESVRFSFDNYTRGIESFNFWRYLANSVTVTASATILTLFVNSMAAFALSKYRFRGRGVIFMLIISTLMVPPVCDPGAGFPADHRARLEQPAHRHHHSDHRHADRRFPTAPVYADDSGRIAGFGAD